MIWFKACPKCGGDLARDRDIYGPYISCLACGYYLSEAEEIILLYSPDSRRPIGTKREEREPVLV